MITCGEIIPTVHEHQWELSHHVAGNRYSFTCSCGENLITSVYHYL